MGSGRWERDWAAKRPTLGTAMRGRRGRWAPGVRRQSHPHSSPTPTTSDPPAASTAPAAPTSLLPPHHPPDSPPPATTAATAGFDHKPLTADSGSGLPLPPPPLPHHRHQPHPAFLGTSPRCFFFASPDDLCALPQSSSRNEGEVIESASPDPEVVRCLAEMVASIRSHSSSDSSDSERVVL